MSMFGINKVLKAFRLVRRIFLFAVAVAGMAGIYKLSKQAVRQKADAAEVVQYMPGHTAAAIPDDIFFSVPRLSGKEHLIVRSAYVTSYNESTKNPDWVAWTITSETAFGEFSRLQDFFEDESIKGPRATNDDYRGSGWDRGHMCPAADNKWDKTAMYESFILTNICPQDKELNAGLWNELEQACRKAARRYGQVWLCCGPVYYNKSTAPRTIGRNEVTVPDGFFKVALTLEPKIKTFGFLVPNSGTLGDLKDYVVDVCTIEKITGRVFFPLLDDSIEVAVKSEVPDLKYWKF